MVIGAHCYAMLLVFSHQLKDYRLTKPSCNRQPITESERSERTENHPSDN